MRSVPPELKYASEGGPTLRDCFALVRNRSVRPAVDVMKLLDAAIFNVVVGNADAHGKNFSLLYELEGPRLAPLYDLLVTTAYPELSAKFAMRIGRRATLETLDAKAWTAFAADAGLGSPMIRRRVVELCEKVRSGAHDIAGELNISGLDQAALSRFAAMVVDRAERCALKV